MVDYIFYLCVDFLAWLEKVTGTTYELVNIVIFIIGYMVITIFQFLLMVIFIYMVVKGLRKTLKKPFII